MKMNTIEFLKLFRLYIKYYKGTKNYWEKKKPITIEIWEDKYNVVNEYLIETKQVKILAINFNVKFARKMFDWLLNRMGHNHAVRHIEKCKAVLDFGGREGYVNTNPINFLKIKREPPKKPPYFTPQQIQLVEQYESSLIQKQKARDMLIVQLHTGYDYGDFAEIKKENITEYMGAQYLVKGRHKNGIESVCQLSDKLKEVLIERDFKLKLLPNGTYNKVMKEIFKELEIDIYLSSKGIRKLFLMHKLNNEGYSLEFVSKAAGHKYTKTTEDYYVQKNINLIHQEAVRKNEGNKNIVNYTLKPPFEVEV